ncbi:hypothetical protein GpartN1_g3015.t1 [Galdieria partita]|uniref:Phytanoyl-CoA dioxygenase n=1 Tax=Galdieria partita TaxID=83374 RepID=A0A9C7PW05_9RHOD|nr:hypothetical protein GpartN1_g2666.t1 [Galdieria partita]GJQ11224.1 hypothetical protein GpartN1_g3015.t1 [Galdieria partita]
MNLSSFIQYGYQVIPHFINSETCTLLIRRTLEWVKSLPVEQVSIFSTENQRADAYFLESGRSIRLFFEEEAATRPESLTIDKERMVNKIGHALHDLDPIFRSFSRSQSVKSLAFQLGFQIPIPVQSMVILKQPRVGGEVRPHQDSTFLYTHPPSCVGLWWALQDATVDNGCLWVLEGSHKCTIHKRMCRTPDGKGIYFYEENPKDCDYTRLDNYKPVECKAGSLVILHGALWHFSCKNRSNQSRHAYSLHLVEGKDTVWSPHNWLQPNHLPFEPFKVDNDSI